MLVSRRHGLCNRPRRRSNVGKASETRRGRLERVARLDRYFAQQSCYGWFRRWWRRKRLLRNPMGAGSTPAEAERARSSVVEHRNRRFRIFPIVASTRIFIAPRGEADMSALPSLRRRDRWRRRRRFLLETSPFPIFPHRLCSGGAASRFLRVTTGGRKPASCPRREGAPRRDFPWRLSAAATGSGYFVTMERAAERKLIRSGRRKRLAEAPLRPDHSPLTILCRSCCVMQQDRLQSRRLRRVGALLRGARRGSGRARSMISAMKRRRPEGSKPQP